MKMILCFQIIQICTFFYVELKRTSKTDKSEQKRKIKQACLNRIEEELSKIRAKEFSSEKRKQIIEEFQEKEIIIEKGVNKSIFQDQTSMHNFLTRLKRYVDKLKEKENPLKEELELIEYYKLLEEQGIRRKHLTLEEKVQELIVIIHDLERLQKQNKITIMKLKHFFQMVQKQYVSTMDSRKKLKF